MKKIILALIAILAFGYVNAQTKDSLRSRIGKDSIGFYEKKTKPRIVIDTDAFYVVPSTNPIDSIKPKTVKFPYIIYGVYVEHIDLGFSRYHTNGNFSTPSGYGYLEYEPFRTLTFGFDALQVGLRFNPNFKIMLSAGIDWTDIRLKENVTILPKKTTLTAQNETIEFSKNRFSSCYLRLPLYFEYRSAQNRKGKRTSLVLGPEVGFLIGGKTKQISKENGKVKVHDDFNFAKVKYGANIRIGYGLTGLFFKYYINDVYANNEGPSNYKNLAFGLTFGF
jgi:hypothetical protein